MPQDYFAASSTADLLPQNGQAARSYDGPFAAVLRTRQFFDAKSDLIWWPGASIICKNPSVWKFESNLLVATGKGLLMQTGLALSI